MKKAELKNRLLEMVKTKPKESGIKYYMHCYNGLFKVSIEGNGASRCCLFNDQNKALEWLKKHRKTEISIYKTAGQELPSWSRGLAGTLYELLPGMALPLTSYLKYQNPTFYYADETPEAYASKISSEGKEIMAGFSRIYRYTRHEV